MCDPAGVGVFMDAQTRTRVHSTLTHCRVDVHVLLWLSFFVCRVQSVLVVSSVVEDVVASLFVVPEDRLGGAACVHTSAPQLCAL